MRNAVCLASACALLSTIILSPANAEDKKLNQTMDTVTVYATKSKQSTFDVPAMVSQIDVDSAGNALSGDVSDLLEFTPGVEVENSPRRNGQVVSIRGFDDEAIITLIDGRRQNFEAAHDGRFFLDTSLLKSVEVVKGASSSIYGGGAVGGVVAFETKDAADLLEPGQDFGVQTSFGYRSGNNEYAPLVTAFGQKDGWDLLGSVAYRDSGDIELGNGSELDTEDNIQSALLKAGYDINEYNNIKFQFQRLHNDGQEPNNGAGAITASNPIVGKEITDNQFSIQYEFDSQNYDWLNPKAHLYLNDTEVEETDLTGTNAGRVQSRELRTIGFTLDNQSQIIVGDDHTQTLSYGFEIYRDEQVGVSSAAAVRGGVPDAEATNYGFYLQDEIALDTSAGDFLIIPAARFDEYSSEDEVGNSQDESKISPKLALSYKPIDDVVIFGSWAKAFRAPNLTEIYPAGQHFPGVSFCPAPVPGCPPVPVVVVFPDNNFVANPALAPETVTTTELGIGFDFDNIFNSEDRAKIKTSVFHSEGNDFISQAVDIGAGTTTNFNVPNARLIGFEAEGQYQLNPITAKIGLTYVEAENDDTGEYLSNNVPLTFITDFAYNIDSINSIAGFRSRYAQAAEKVGDVATAGYGVHDLYYRWAPDEVGLETLTVDLGIDNILDKSYSRRFATLREEGRSYGMRVSYKW